MTVPYALNAPARTVWAASTAIHGFHSASRPNVQCLLTRRRAPTAAASQEHGGRQDSGAAHEVGFARGPGDAAPAPARLVFALGRRAPIVVEGATRRVA